MGGESPKPASAPTGAVFLSYASQDAEAAQKICEALRAAGIEVWFDQSELRGGDAWDQSIRRQIKSCALFIPLISRHTHERAEGYFRLEWKLAVDRSHLIMANKAFLLPVVVDDTRDDDENVPDKFRDVQWTRLPAGETLPAFVERVRRLLSGEASTTIRAGAASGASPAIGGRSPATGWSRRVLPAAVAVVALGAMAYLAIDRPWISKPMAASPTLASPALAAFAPPPHSIAVLPFVNMSGDKEQEYFSDGLTEEILNSLSRINELQVAARTSAFAFKGKDTDIGTIARKLNVGAILEGSVRRSGHTIRVTAQLNNAVSGFHLWSQTYDRDLGDVLKLQAEISNAVAEALKVTLLGDISQKIELGGTRNPAAFDAYLRASKAFLSRRESKDIRGAIDAYSEAIRLDGHYALAFAYRSFARTTYASSQTNAAEVRHALEQAEADARRAIALTPELAEAHLALGYSLENQLREFAQVREAFDRATALAPGNVQVLLVTSEGDTWMGFTDRAIAAARRAIVLDPLDRRSHSMLGRALYAARRYREAADAHAEAIRVNPGYKQAYGERGLAFYGFGDLEHARASCEIERDDSTSQLCLAVVYDKLGRHADARAEVTKLKATDGDASGYECAGVYAQWGDLRRALESLDDAMRLRDPGLVLLKTDPLVDPLRKDPRFQAIERALKFPN